MFAGRQAGRAFHKEATCAPRREITRFLSATVCSSMLEAEGGRRGELGWDRVRHRGLTALQNQQVGPPLSSMGLLRLSVCLEDLQEVR